MNIFVSRGAFTAAAPTSKPQQIGPVDPDADMLRDLIRYEPETGRFYWRERGPEWFSEQDGGDVSYRRASWNTKNAGHEINSPSIVIRSERFDNYSRKFSKARVAWLIAYGSLPDGRIFHANGDESDYRLENLTRKRPIGRRARIDNKAGAAGTRFCADRNRYRASVGRKHIGYYATIEEAVRARDLALSQGRPDGC